MIDIKISQAHRLMAPRLTYLVGSNSTEDRPNCIPISNVTSVCTEPEVIGISVYKEWQTCENLRSAEGFTLSLPRSSQLSTAWKLGAKYSGYADISTRPKEEEFREFFDFDFSDHGPVLLDSIGWIECRIIRRVDDIGDHMLLLGEVTHAKSNPACYDPDALPVGNPMPLMQWVHNSFSTSQPRFFIDYFNK